MMKYLQMREMKFDMYVLPYSRRRLIMSIILKKSKKITLCAYNKYLQYCTVIPRWTVLPEG